MMLLFFFFSSRRRHTRCSRDWSSDVCSSDLFIAKFYIFMAAVSAGMTGLAVLAVIFAAVSAYYYLRVVMVMYMRDPGEAAGTPGYNVRGVVSPATIAVLLVASVPRLILGVFPDQLVKAAQSALLPLK